MRSLAFHPQAEFGGLLPAGGPHGGMRARVESADLEIGRPTGLRAAAKHVEERQLDDRRRIVSALQQSELGWVGGLLGNGQGAFVVEDLATGEAGHDLLITLSQGAKRTWGRTLLGAVGLAEGRPWTQRVLELLDETGYTGSLVKTGTGEPAVLVRTVW